MPASLKQRLEIVTYLIEKRRLKEK